PRVLQLRQAVRIGLPPPDDLVHRRPAPEGLAHLTDERLALGLEQELEEAQRLGVVRHVPDAVPGKLLGVGGGVGGDLAVELVDAMRCAGPPAGDSVPACAEDPPPPEVTVITTSTAAGSTPNRSRNVRQVASRSVAISSGEGFLAFETTRK